MTGHQSSGPSLWQMLSESPRRRGQLRGPHEAEIVIVGAGIAGLSLALHLANEGFHPVVIEAETPGAGALGASAGIIAPQLVRDTPTGVVRKLGPTLGEAWLKLVAESGNYLFDLIRREEIHCDARPFGFIAPTTSADSPERLQAVRREWSAYRNDLDVIGPAEIERRTGCKGYRAAIVDHSGGCLDPLKLARELARRAEQKGVTIFDDSRVIELNESENRWQLKTQAGSIKADKVVLCANGGNDLFPGLQQTVLPMHIYEMATEPVSAEMRQQVLPGGECMTDMELDIFSIRYAAGNRLVTAYPVTRYQNVEQVETQVNRRLEQMLLQPHPVRISQMWHGTAWINSSLLPRIVQMRRGLLAVQACNGRGIATNLIIGREIARMIVEDGYYRSELACPAPERIPRFWINNKMLNAMMSTSLLLRRFRNFMA